MSAAPPDRRAIITEALRKIDDLTAQLEVAEKSTTEPIAVVGIGCRFPGAVDDADTFWQFLTDGASGIVRVPADRWDADAYYSEDHTVPGTICTREGGFLTSWQPDEFDAEFFSISPREAAGMDPQQRLLLEVAWEALENAGITPQRIRGTQTSVFVGLTTNDYYQSFSGKLRPQDIDPYIPFGNASNFAAGRLSYFLGVRGEAVVLDTACSSSLTAVHLACQSLRRRDSDNALVAGVNLILSPENSIACSRWGMLSPGGQCRTFDAAADGYVRSEGCGVVVLKRLGDAQRDGDRVLAVVRGSAVNQDGASSGQTVPNGPAQQALLRRALEASRLQPSDIDYVEAHGTGTALGDPIELDALSQVFADRDGSAPLVLGSVKTNLGHLESAAGIAGFIKTVLSVQHGHIPRHLNFERLTPQAGAGASAFTIASTPMDWPTVDRPRRAGVSSFGVSGTNAHVVIEQAPDSDPVAAQPEPPVTTLLVSAKTTARVAATAGMLADWMAGAGADVRLAEVAHTLNHHRARQPRFATVTACSRDQAVAGLRALAEGYPAPGVVGPHDGQCGPGTVFVYSGQGSQWAGMGRQLLADEPAFAAAVAALEPAFVEQTGFSLEQVLRSDEAVSGIDRIQPVLVGVQLALTELWRAHGVQPDAVIGHSMGEVTAAVVAGALSPADGLRVIATRSRLMARLSGQGAMALLELDAATTEELIASYSGLTVAVYAAPRQTVIAGPPDQVDAVIAVVDAQDKLARRIDVDVASHHPIIDPVLPELRAALAGLAPQPPSIPIITTTREPSNAATVFDADYWAANLRNPVRFTQAVAAAGAEHTTFVEVSPHPLLTYAIAETLAEAHHHSIGTLQRDTHDTLTFHTNVNAIHTIRPPELPHPPGTPPVVPATPWHHTRHWITLHGEPADAQPGSGHTGPVSAFDDWFCELTWPIRELGAAEEAGDGSWLVLAEPEVGDELAQLLGAGSRTLAPSALDEEGDQKLREALTGVENVLYLPSVPPVHRTVEAGYRLFHAVRRLAVALAGMTSSSKRPPVLRIVTRNAQPVGDGARANAAHALLWGLGGTLALEHPEIWGGVIDVDDSVPPELVARYVLAEVKQPQLAHAENGERGSEAVDDQVVYQAGVRHVPRLVRRSPPAVGLTRLERNTSHLVIGATGNVGPHLIRQLAEMGAATVVAVSRRGGSQLDELANELAPGGTTVVQVAADAADEAAMTALFERFGNDLPPLDGIYLAALAGGEALLSDMTDDDVRAMFRPKLDAAVVLHKLSLRIPLRRFVLFSSITGILGSRGVAHYTAANAFLDTFAYARRALGLSATVVDWGLWKSWADAQPGLTAAGLLPMPNEVAIRALPAVLSPDGGVQSAVVAADWRRLADAYRMRTSLRVLDTLLTGDTGAPASIEDVGLPEPGTLLGKQVEASSPARLWQARLAPDTRPYPGDHRVRGVPVVPVSVLLQTLSAAAAQQNAAAMVDVRFEYPVLADQQRVIHTVADGDSITVSSSSAPDTPAQRWTRHVSARVGDWPAGPAPDTEPQAGGADLDNAVLDGPAITELQQKWGIEGKPFEWSISSCGSVPGGLRAEVGLPGASAVELLDAAVHLARLAGSDDPRLMLPAAVDGIRFAADITGAAAVVEVWRRGAADNEGDELVVDLSVKSPDGRTYVDIRGLHYAAVDSGVDSAVDSGLASSQIATPGSTGTAGGSADAPDWAQLSAAEALGELKTRLKAILARELGMPASAVGDDQPFPELGLDSMMAMNFLRDAKQLTRIDLSATLLWNHPTISSFAGCLAEMLVPVKEADKEPEADDADLSADSMSVLDALFDSVESDPESAPASSESGI